MDTDFDGTGVTGGLRYAGRDENPEGQIGRRARYR